MTFSDTTAEIGASFRTDGRTDRRGSQNSYLDFLSIGKNKMEKSVENIHLIKGQHRLSIHFLNPIAKVL